VIPRTALHEGSAYLVDAEGRLDIRPVDVGLQQPELVSIRAGLEAGARLVISDLMPAIAGMRLEPHGDEGAQRRLVELAEARPE
jgi:hypothetical protein